MAVLMVWMTGCITPDPANTAQGSGLLRNGPQLSGHLGLLSLFLVDFPHGGWKAMEAF